MAYLLFWGVFAYITLAQRRALLAALFCSMSFGAFSVLPPAMTGGITILPRVMFALALLATTLFQPGGARRAWSAMVSVRRLGLLGGFVLVAAFASFVMPHLFAGRVVVVGLNTVRPELLRPSAGLFTQLIYLALSYSVALAVCLAAEQPGGRSTLVNAVVAGALTVTVTGLLDVATHGTGLLDPFRNATYRMLVTGEILGNARIVGLMSEASAYGGLAAGLGATAYFLARSIDVGTIWGKVARLAPLWALTMAALSTSSTALLALMIFIAVAALDWLIRAAKNPELRERKIVFGQFVGVSLLALLLALAALAKPELVRPATALVDRMIFHKVESASYVERSMWNSVSLRAFAATHGLGVGMGGSRTSSWLVALVSSTGVAGTLLMAAFLIRFLTASASDPRDRPLLYGAKLSWMVAFVPGAVASPSADFGVLNAALFGIMAGLQQGSSPVAVDRSRRVGQRPSSMRAPLARRRRSPIRAGRPTPGYAPASAVRPAGD